MMFLLGNANYAIIVLIGCLRVAKGQMPLGNVQAFIQYSRMFTQPITQIASMANLLQSGVASAERVFQVLDADELSTDAHGSSQPRRDESSSTTFASPTTRTNLSSPTYPWSQNQDRRLRSSDPPEPARRRW
ncbi:lipid A export ATP-binding/permease protein MsbA [Cutibacterium acnes JCM 18909]|nr:lipid A export ATP-binding/permease protein MsbA [Cutibacterium acnes JCM 18909]